MTTENPDPHMGDVPDKQLHRWKGEGGALPPEPEAEQNPEDSEDPTAKPEEA
ncbi:hypothetical protein [Crystallibacter crystallopoietes]|uniref:hypothetical protein n=1 Tax=Crystallibacter crystallopoietes TaxID=37928 RepID=UPI00167F7913|nr:hypothetical protein [Arthrobacter crystallopoietes]